MIFGNILLTSVLAATAAALPHRVRDSSSGNSSSGSVQFVNNMDSDVYLWTTSSDPGSMKTLSSGGGTYSEEWQTNSNGGGISIKLSTTQSEDSVLQFEYTVDSETLYWDLSSINLDESSEFVKNGFSAVPSDSSCTTATCKPGDVNCAESYQHPDDVNTLSCSVGAQYTVTLG
ncbi:Secreted thaumatin-like protein calA [Penicillium macrosclerotiorum]|uniref:Secreted thaumatin-like protein calA n=1 Tax=Penicillium macrosclerotiorum TaxID=303699 RepID=UPI002549877C|nr:Secreted thaumatin-like protein calA [Penicillium macrosclerotiorum]KAJ5669310.1 Secreted thaumatin-like protein calA [Penicillium macrosclerotiorum]